MKIVDLICSAGMTGFFTDDQKAIKSGAVMDGNAYFGNPMTSGFTAIRQAGESISVMLLLEDGQIACGDCAAVQYSGAGGRDPIFLAKDYIPVIEEQIRPLLVGREITSFREMALKCDSLPLHTAVRYGVTQAILDAVAKSNKTFMAAVVAKEYKQPLNAEKVPVFSQSGDDRYSNVDKMIIKRSDVMPHGLFNSVSKTGEKGEKLREYVAWLRERVKKLCEESGYLPVFHIDVYGILGIIFNNDLDKIADYMLTLEAAAGDHLLRIEGPVDMGNRTDQIAALAALCEKIEERGGNVRIVADEWCNTYEDIVLFTNNKAGHQVQIKTPDLGGINNSIEAVLYCKAHGMGAYLGGTCNETDRSAIACAHIAMATKPEQVLAKPGMGVDEGFMIVNNEIQRIRALINASLNADGR